MISDSLAKVLNEQVNAEYYSASLYQAMSAYAESAGLKGVANWLWIQSREETAHGVHIYQYLLERDALPAFDAIAAPPSPTSFNNLLEVFEAVYAHEQKVTALTNNIATIAMKENDHACYQFILWYVNEQVEEEANAKETVSRLKLIGDNSGGLLALDTEFAARTYINPFPTDVKLM